MALQAEERSMLRDQARAWVRKSAPVSALRLLRERASTLGYDRELFQAMADLGWVGIVIPEVFGGSDFGHMGCGIVLEETGRTLLASPLLANTAAAGALLLGASEAAKASYLEPMATGVLIATLAVDEGPRHAPERIAMQAQVSAAGFVLNGEKTYVSEGMAAGLLVVCARTSGASGDTHGLSMFLVPANLPGIERRALTLIDGRGAADIRFSNVQVGPEALLGEIDGGWGILEATLDRARACLAAEMLGSAHAAFDMILDYLKTRVQFGQPIGAFQALQHRAARMFGELELSRSCVEGALAAIDAGSANAPALCSLAKAHVGATLFLVSNEAIQMHGGIGMTDAHDAGLYLKRARTAEQLFGNRAFHTDRFARLNGF